MPKPNILIVMTDHQRADTVLPENPARTPHLEQFAQEGVTFTETYCPTAHCSPSRATFFSGLYPSGHGVWNNVCNDQALARGPKDGVRLWSEDLADRTNYQLHWLGKWHVSSIENPESRGWTNHFSSSGPEAYHGESWETYEKIAARPAPTERGEGQILRPGYGDYTLYSTDDTCNPHDNKVTDKAVEILPQLAESDTPWCLYVGLIGPHDPYHVPQEYLDLYDLADIELPTSYADAMRDKPVVYQRMRDQVFGQLSEREVREGIRHFMAYCSYLDALFGRILEALDATGQADDTLVIYTADHGDYCGDHGLFAKGVPNFRGAYQVPNIMRWPKGIGNPGRRVDAFVSLADFGPTFLDLADAMPDRRFTGRSLTPFLENRAPEAWRDAIHTQFNGVELYYTQRSIRTKRHKYVFNGFDPDELYDIENDPDEMVNVTDDPTYADAKRDLVGRMWRFAREEKDAATNGYVTVGLAPYGPAEAFRQDEAPDTTSQERSAP